MQARHLLQVIPHALFHSAASGAAVFGTHRQRRAAGAKRQHQCRNENTGREIRFHARTPWLRLIDRDQSLLSRDALILPLARLQKISPDRFRDCKLFPPARQALPTT